MIHVLPEGSPTQYNRFRSLDEARRKLRVLTQREDGGWHIFDLDENKRVKLPKKQ